MWAAPDLAAMRRVPVHLVVGDDDTETEVLRVPQDHPLWVRGAEQAHALGLTVNAGHGINYVNVAEIRTLPHLHECNIGHSIISRALFTGIDEAVGEMRKRLND